MPTSVMPLGEGTLVCKVAKKQISLKKAIAPSDNTG